jgi:putative chitinase
MNLDQFQRAADIDRGQAIYWYPHIDFALGTWGILEPENTAAFVAQAKHESAGFTRIIENLYYTTEDRLREVFRVFRNGSADPAEYVRQPAKLANLVYANRLGNGGPESGDGWRFKGRGLFQITGRDNYTRMSDALGVDLIQHPELLEQPEHAAMSAAAYWTESGCSEVFLDPDEVTRRINGSAMLGAYERRIAYERAREVLLA